ncbi:MAG: DUF1700 domain-containing protein [Oscillospiraceae bacterium]|jgi:uncharacterized membrane protein|nr:DUF1700 domain-containing protein [Oscillospiraceae bacterium]
MTKQEYLDKLRRLLRALPQEEIDAAVSFYEEYLGDAENEAEAIAALGPPREVAGRIAAEIVAGGGTDTEPDAIESDTTEPETETDITDAVAMPDTGMTPAPRKKRASRIIPLLILAVFALPIGLPVAAVLAIVVALSLLTLALCVICVGITAAAAMLGGLIYVLMGIITALQSFALGIAAIGIGLASIGVGWLLLRATIWMWRICARAASKLGKAILRRSKR